MELCCQGLQHFIPGRSMPCRPHECIPTVSSSNPFLHFRYRGTVLQESHKDNRQEQLHATNTRVGVCWNSVAKDIEEEVLHQSSVDHGSRCEQSQLHFLIQSSHLWDDAVFPDEDKIIAQTADRKPLLSTCLCFSIDQLDHIIITVKLLPKKNSQSILGYLLSGSLYFLH